jgi:UDP-N-acetylglucosamine--N-acetylmuramyl-(pentapeptide) pyrophosphoryl-undecaprenol N-acetylglucosamine transferase
MESALIPSDINLFFIPKTPFPRKPSPQMLSFPFRLSKSIKQCKNILREQRADVLLGFGSYVAAPAYIAAKELGIPILIHEQNAKVGLANKFASKIAKKVFITFPNTNLTGKNVELVGMPLRENIINALKNTEDAENSESSENSGSIDNRENNENTEHNESTENVMNGDTYERLGLSPSEKTLLVLGGSLGAVAINNAVSRAAKAITEKIQVIHITGKGKAEGVLKALKDQKVDSEKYKVFEYVKDLSDILSISDFAISRAGASSVVELNVFKVPSCFVPLKIGNGEQALNVQESLKNHFCIVCKNNNFSDTFIKDIIIPLIKNTEKLEYMKSKSKQTLDATSHIADYILQTFSNKQIDKVAS